MPETLTTNEFHERASATHDEISGTVADARQGDAVKAMNTEGP